VQFGDYTRTLVQVGVDNNGSPLPPAFLYHEKTYDPSTYQPIDRSNLQSKQSAPAKQTPATVSQPVAASASVSASSSDDDDFDDDLLRTDYRGRLLVPTSYLRQAGFKSGENLFVLTEANQVKLAKTNNGAGKEQKVERDGDIRLSATTLLAAGLTGDKFIVQTKGDSVVLTAKP
jgi:hypothetical protein